MVTKGDVVEEAKDAKPEFAKAEAEVCGKSLIVLPSRFCVDEIAETSALIRFAESEISVTLFTWVKMSAHCKTCEHKQFCTKYIPLRLLA